MIQSKSKECDMPLKNRGEGKDQINILRGDAPTTLDVVFTGGQF